MIAKFILSSLIALLLSTGLIVKSAETPAGTLNSQPAPEMTVKAVMIDGEAVPHISLPVVEITAEYPTDDLVTAGIVDGKIVPMIELEEVVVTPGSGTAAI